MNQITSETELELLESRYWDLRKAHEIRVYIQTFGGEKPQYFSTLAETRELPPWNCYDCTPVLVVPETKLPLISARELLEATANEAGDLVIGIKTISAIEHVRRKLS